MQFALLSDPVAQDASTPPFSASPHLGNLSPPVHRAALYDILLTEAPSLKECWVGIWDGYGSFGYPRSMGYVSAASRQATTRSGRLGPVRRQRFPRLRTAPWRRGDATHDEAVAGLADIARRVSEAPRFEQPGRAYLLARIELAHVGKLERHPLRAAANLVWPDDHSWFVATEIDFDSTLVGGTRSLIDAVHRRAELEVVEVGPGDRLDADGDEFNRAQR